MTLVEITPGRKRRIPDEPTGILPCVHRCERQASSDSYRCHLHERCSPDGECGRSCRTCPDHDLADVVVAVNPPPPSDLPGRPAFNCSLLDLPDGRTLFAFRLGKRGSRLAMCELDRNHQPGPSWLLESERFSLDAACQEDPRLFLHNGDLYCSYIGVRSGSKGVTTHQCLMRLSADGRHVFDSWCPAYSGRRSWEKNWGFFSQSGELYAVYSINPHRVLRIHGDVAELIAETPGPDPRRGDQWRGGAPPVLHRGEWYHWFHGKLSKAHDSEYWVGLYTFEAAPPFRPRRVVRSKILLPHKPDRPSLTVPHCVFPCGAVLRGSKWVVSYGYYDHLCRIAEFEAARVETWLEAIG